MTISSINGVALSSLSAIDGRMLSGLSAVNGQSVVSSDFDYTGLIWRVRAADIIGLSNGDPITTNWLDTSGNTRNWAPTNSPTWRSTDGPNSKPCVKFVAASSQYFTGPDISALLLTAAEVFIVIKANSDPSASSTSSGIWTLCNGPTGNPPPSGDGAALCLYPFTDGNVYERAFTAGTRTSNNFATTLAQWNLYNPRSPGIATNYNNYLNGVAGSTPQTNGVYSPIVTYLGRSSIVGIDWYLDGNVAEFFAFSLVTSGAQRTSINSYMNSFYSITVS